MNSNTVIVQNALKKYDDYNEKYSKLLKDIDEIKFSMHKEEMDHNIIKMYKKGKLIYALRFEILGVYANKYKVWTWAWSNPIFKKNSVRISKQILKYGLDLNDDKLFLKAELTTSRFRVTDPIQLDLHVAIASYLSKKPHVYKFIYHPDKKLEVANINVNEKIKGDDFLVYYLFILDTIK
jgi:hypothetical protein